MTLVVERSAPTRADAECAAEVLCRMLDPGMVLLFGSVARGNQTRWSDLDMVLVFDDLGDYSTRRDLKNQALEAIVEATGYSADVKVTDRPEWEIRTKQCRSTFEAHIAKHAVTIAERPPKTPIQWDKEIGMAPSDERQASGSLSNIIDALDTLLHLLKTSDLEIEARLAGNFQYADEKQHSRMMEVCAKAQATMENALKSLIHALKGPHPERTHDIGVLLYAAQRQLSEPEAQRLRTSLGDISPREVSVWRVLASYSGDEYIQGDPDAATPEFANQMSSAATAIARTCVELIGTTLGYRPSATKEVLAQCDRIEQKISEISE